MSETLRPRFVSKLGHELRTPLGSVLMLSELLAGRDGLDDKALRYVDKIHQAAMEMRALLDEVSVLAKIEGGRIELFLSDVEVAGLARDLQERLAPRAREHGKTLAVAREDDLPAMLRTDRARVDESLDLVVETALRSSGCGTVSVRVGRDERADAPTGSALTIAVTDCGPVIPESDREVVFEPFNLADPRARHLLGGKSLRLTIARGLARLLGGELTLEGDQNRNVLRLRLPLTP